MSHPLLKLSNISYKASSGELFKDVTLSVRNKEKIALIGKNGAGKSTLLKIIAGILEPDSGKVDATCKIGYVPQVVSAEFEKLLISILLQTSGYTYEKFADVYKHIFSSSVPKQDKTIGSLSGGELTKLLVTIEAMSESCLLLLDEPTNHLDRKSLGELEKWLVHYEGAVILVSHNRVFIERTARTIWELNSENISIFRGSYKDFLQQREHVGNANNRQYEATKKELSKLREGIRKREMRASRAEKVGRERKHDVSRSPGEEDYFRNRSEKGVGNIKKKHDAEHERLHESLQKLKRPAQKRINIPLESHSKKRQFLIATEHLPVKANGHILIDAVSLRIEYGDRIVIHGDNGSGKSLLLKTIVGETERKALLQIKTNNNIKTAYIDQKYTHVTPDKTVYENLESHSTTRDKEKIFKQLGRFRFPQEYVHKQASELSGGETARLAIAIATIESPDLLILDEPTNNLDIETIETISEALEDFNGALIVVSHDQSFLDDLKIDRVYEIRNKEFRIIQSHYAKTAKVEAGG